MKQIHIQIKAYDTTNNLPDYCLGSLIRNRKVVRVWGEVNLNAYLSLYFLQMLIWIHCFACCNYYCCFYVMIRRCYLCDLIQIFECRSSVIFCPGSETDYIWYCWMFPLPGLAEVRGVFYWSVEWDPLHFILFVGCVTGSFWQFCSWKFDPFEFSSKSVKWPQLVPWLVDCTFWNFVERWR